MPSKLRHGQRQRVFDALKAGNGYGLSDAALWRDINAGKWDDHPSAGAPQGAPRKAPADKGVSISIYPLPHELESIDRQRGATPGNPRGDKSRTEWLLTEAGIRQEGE